MQLIVLLKKGMRYLLDKNYRFLIHSGLGCYNHVPDKEYLQKRFKAKMGKTLNLTTPVTFNEKLQWLKLYDRKPEYTMMVDKVAVKAYVAEIIGKEYIIPTLGVWENQENIDFDALPDQFVLKCNHNSGLGMCICKDKSKLNIAKVKRGLKKGLQQNYYLSGREWPYKNVKHRIIAEEYMVDETGTGLRDYKVMCFGGEPKLIQIHQGRYRNHTQDFYDTQWNKQNITQGCPMSDIDMEHPAFLEEMLNLSSKLAKDIPQIRVDWYYVKDRLFFGELTFFDASGFDAFEPDIWDEVLGSWITLPNS